MECNHLFIPLIQWQFNQNVKKGYRQVLTSKSNTHNESLINRPHVIAHNSQPWRLWSCNNSNAEVMHNDIT